MCCFSNVKPDCACKVLRLSVIHNILHLNQCEIMHATIINTKSNCVMKLLWKGISTRNRSLFTHYIYL